MFDLVFMSFVIEQFDLGNLFFFLLYLNLTLLYHILTFLKYFFNLIEIVLLNLFKFDN